MRLYYIAITSNYYRFVKLVDRYSEACSLSIFLLEASSQEDPTQEEASHW